MKRTLMLLALLVGAVGFSHAADPTFEVAYSSYAAVGFKCSSGTPANITATRPTGFRANVAGYRITNTNATYTMFIGTSTSVSTSTFTGANASDWANLGEPIYPRANAPYPVGKDYQSGTALVPLYCKCEDGAGASGCIAAVVWFGY